MTRTIIFSVIFTAIVYFVFNLYVTKRINKSFYLNEERRALHRNLIWIVPFVGPLMIISFWKKDKKVKSETITKDEREKKKGDFYESGIGVNDG